MKAVAVERGAAAPRVIERPAPVPEEGEALVRTLRVGIDGTDHEVIAGGHGGYPEGEDRLVLGHEAVGVVSDANGTAIEEGTFVVPTVRRPPPGVDTNPYFERGEPDMAPPGAYVERGIDGADGYMSEYFTSPTEFLVPIPGALAPVGFLVEPLSNAEKALELAAASRSSFEWRPSAATVLGNGPLGLLSLAMLAADGRFDRLYGLGRRDRPDPTIDVIERLGATYVDSRSDPVSGLGDSHERMDLVVEATGHAPHAFECIAALAAGGVGALLGIPGEDAFEVAGGSLHREAVLGNKALVGSVNSHVRHFERAIERLGAFPDWFAGELVTGVYPPEEASTAFETDRGGIKTAIEFAPP